MKINYQINKFEVDLTKNQTNVFSYNVRCGYLFNALLNVEITEITVVNEVTTCWLLILIAPVRIRFACACKSQIYNVSVTITTRTNIHLCQRLGILETIISYRYQSN